jgi:NAD(P)-dependent dehydrogenase (short-subunit alcohol dehydrogenase family)
MTANSHSGRVALISGASSGVGAHIARLLARGGARVALAARRTERLAEIVEFIRAEGYTATAVTMDVAEADSVAAAFDSTERELGVVDTVVANAGVARVAPALKLTPADVDQTLLVNLRGAFLLASEGARRMVSHGVNSGRVLCIASIGGHTVLPGLAAYSAAKAGVIMMGRSLAAEWARYKITVNTICPGYMRTPMNDGWFATEGGQEQIAGFPNRRLMPVEALDPAVLYLTSDAAAYTTGAVVTVDDGQSL